MSCNSPVLAVCYGPNPEDPKKLKVKLLPQRVDYNLASLREKYGSSLLTLPCGKCIGCVSDYAKSWSDRIVLESSLYEKNCFITLTYKDAPKLPQKDHVRDFIRSLRAAHPDIRIRFFAVGELGSKTERSHYHIILFNYDFGDKKPFKKDGTHQLYRSEELETLWPYGISSIGAVSPSSAAYCAQYSMKKKLSGQSQGEFIMMSTHPGIGYQYFENHKNDIFLSDSCYTNNAPGRKLSIPRYFRKLADREQEIVPGYDRFLSKIRKGISINRNRTFRSVENEEISLQMDECLANKVQIVRSKI